MKNTNNKITLVTHIEDERWRDMPLIQEESLRNILETALQATPYQHWAPLEVSLRFTDDQVIQEINTMYRGKNKPTNVLSFPLYEEGFPRPPDECILLGDIVLSFDTMWKEHQEKGISLDLHTCHLLLHGFFHLLGYDHEEDAEAEVMETLEKTCLEKLGFTEVTQCS